MYSAYMWQFSWIMAVLKVTLLSCPEAQHASMRLIAAHATGTMTSAEPNQAYATRNKVSKEGKCYNSDKCIYIYMCSCT